jgi:hypothetical protein
MAETNDGTVAGCDEFIGYTIQHGYVNSNTAASIRTGMKKVRSLIGDLDDQDVRSMDVDDVMRRFRTLARGRDIKDESIDEYERRFRQARAWYIKYLDGDESWKPQRGRVTSKPKSDKMSSRQRSYEPESSTQVIDDRMLSYTIQLRSGDRAELTIPASLTKTDAARLSKFIDALALDEQLALTAGPAS